MKPILFAKTATTFTTNGLGRLNFIKCTVTEERNGQYILEGTIAEDELHASSLEMGSIIVAKPNQTSALQAFRVHKLVKPINGIYELAAQHISYQLSFIPTMPFSITAASTACNSTLQALKSNAAESCPFTFWTNVTTVSSYKQTAPQRPASPSKERFRWTCLQTGKKLLHRHSSVPGRRPMLTAPE